MASVSASCLSFQPLLFHSNKTSLVAGRTSSNMVSGNWAKNGFPSLKASRFRISCAAKPETVDKVCDIVRKQLALAPEIKLSPESKFSELGADSLDTVEIVMELEQEFEISVEEESSQNITTVQEAADLIEKLVEKKA
ncbi:acyl carrier protein 4, chloroplastic [Ricinus communis]|uniref:Acyl carrier protein n=1 Tax=Ricinus communis TaxID=3988 RepID=B9RA82_RICCO|nr:acyl carrier protein 4, chloroplastic [Ricinus communis]EEF51709.1 acyl carrier protein, putative [Ricinus communis]|eukprot:XP_002511107.1 acyl carrier protein 4, chloroplastic [Ricinus communis]